MNEEKARKAIGYALAGAILTASAGMFAGIVKMDRDQQANLQEYDKQSLEYGFEYKPEIDERIANLSADEPASEVERTFGQWRGRLEVDGLWMPRLDRDQDSGLNGDNASLAYHREPILSPHGYESLMKFIETETAVEPRVRNALSRIAHSDIVDIPHRLESTTVDGEERRSPYTEKGVRLEAETLAWMENQFEFDTGHERFVEFMSGLIRKESSVRDRWNEVIGFDPAEEVHVTASRRGYAQLLPEEASLPLEWADKERLLDYVLHYDNDTLRYQMAEALHQHGTEADVWREGHKFVYSSITLTNDTFRDIERVMDLHEGSIDNLDILKSHLFEVCNDIVEEASAEGKLLHTSTSEDPEAPKIEAEEKIGHVVSTQTAKDPEVSMG